MQHIHYCNGPDLPDFPDDVQPKDVNIWLHDSGMVATHDYACPVCRSESAVLSLHNGLFQPCWECQDKGYRLIKKDQRKWWQKLL
ncbi:hypothetical protein [Modicisalibacter coralii]|uniref:hypothetical protein n=1 Tax=Modicisalibacter coralii TaxID=2304602 RepID=UPI00100AB757|nr:hypothetical protein [Halomonas coralii]